MKALDNRLDKLEHERYALSRQWDRVSILSQEHDELFFKLMENYDKYNRLWSARYGTGAWFILTGQRITTSTG